MVRFTQAWKVLKPEKPQIALACEVAWACIFEGFRNCYVACFTQPWKGLKFKKCETSLLASARACVCRWSSCFSRPTGSIFGLLYGITLASPHRFGPPSCLIMFLLPHVSGLLRPPCFTPVMLFFILAQFRNCYVAYFSQAKPERTSNTSDLPRCLYILEGIQIARWHALVRFESLKKPKISISQHAPASVDNRPASATN